MVNTEKFQSRDKYAAFLDGNNGYSVIEGNGEGSILVVKDSYANCFVPFLTENYAKIGVVDLRNFSYGLDSTIESEGYDQVLILYNFQTFIADNRVDVYKRQVQQIVERCLQSAGLSGRGYSPHKLRHTAATLMYQGGVDMLALKEILGHENVSTTQIYTHINQQQLRDAVAASQMCIRDSPLP